jgi:hypothetical protein
MSMTTTTAATEELSEVGKMLEPTSIFAELDRR